MHAALADGRTLRVLTIVDTYTRECRAVEAATGFRGQDGARGFTRLRILPDSASALQYAR